MNDAVRTAFIERRRRAIKVKQDKYRKLNHEYIGKLDTMVREFFENLSSSDEDNQELYQFQNKRWKEAAFRANRTYKGLNIAADSFERMITRNHRIFSINELEPRLSLESLNAMTDDTLAELATNQSKRTATAEGCETSEATMKSIENQQQLNK